MYLRVKTVLSYLFRQVGARIRWPHGNDDEDNAENDDDHIEDDDNNNDGGGGGDDGTINRMPRIFAISI